MKKIIRPIKGKYVENFMTDPLAEKYVEILYRDKRSKNDLHFLFSKKKVKIIKLPKNVKIKSIENNTPTIGAVTIVYVKK